MKRQNICRVVCLNTGRTKQIPVIFTLVILVWRSNWFRIAMAASNCVWFKGSVISSNILKFSTWNQEIKWLKEGCLTKETYANGGRLFSCVNSDYAVCANRTISLFAAHLPSLRQNICRVVCLNTGRTKQIPVIFTLVILVWRSNWFRIAMAASNCVFNEWQRYPNLDLDKTAGRGQLKERPIYFIHR